MLHLLLVGLFGLELLVLVGGVDLHLAISLFLLAHGHGALLVALADLAHERLRGEVRVFG